MLGLLLVLLTIMLLLWLHPAPIQRTLQLLHHLSIIIITRTIIFYHSTNRSNKDDEALPLFNYFSMQMTYFFILILTFFSIPLKILVRWICYLVLTVTVHNSHHPTTINNSNNNNITISSTLFHPIVMPATTTCLHPPRLQCIRFFQVFSSRILMLQELLPPRAPTAGTANQVLITQ